LKARQLKILKSAIDSQMDFHAWLENLGPQKLPFWTSCPSTEEWVIHFLSNHSQSVSWSEFKNKTDWEQEVAGIGYRVPNQPKVNKGGLWLHKDWSVSFDKVDPKAVDGNEIYFFTWSGIEFIFATEKGVQSLLLHAKQEWES
jgi:hypothetical protein